MSEFALSKFLQGIDRKPSHLAIKARRETNFHSLNSTYRLGENAVLVFPLPQGEH